MVALVLGFFLRFFANHTIPFYRERPPGFYLPEEPLSQISSMGLATKTDE